MTVTLRHTINDMAYTKLANSILTSTIWMEDDQTRIVWLTLLAMVDKNGEVQASIPGLANIARVPVDSCRTALSKFLSPDPDSRTRDDEGRRIEEIRGGWLIINHAYYRQLATDEDRRTKAAIRQQNSRDRKSRNAQSHALVTLPSRQIPHTDTDTDTKKKRKKPAPSEPIIFPENLRGEEFQKAWEAWKADRKDRKKPMTRRAEELALADCSAWGPDAAINAIKTSIIRGYTGLFNSNTPINGGKNAAIGPSKFLERWTETDPPMASQFAEYENYVAHFQGWAKHFKKDIRPAPQP